MHPIADVLYKTVVKKFYERNTGFFLFIFYLMFGIVESSQVVSYHLSLIVGLLDSPLFLAIVCVIWTLYLAKCYFFARGVFMASENTFLLQLNAISPLARTGWLMYIFFLADLPVIIYVSVILGVAVHMDYYTTAALIILFHITALFVTAALLQSRIGSLTPSFFRLPSIVIPFPLPFPMYYLSALLNRHKLILVITKAFSFFAIIGFMNIPLDHYEYRTAMMGLLFGIAAHAVVVFEFRRLEDHNMTFVRQLPIKLLVRFGYLAAVYATVLLPELVMIIVNRISLTDVLIIYSGGVACLVFSHCSLYKFLDMDKHITFTLVLFLVGFGLTLFKLLLPSTILLMSVAYYRFHKNYYAYEPVSL